MISVKNIQSLTDFKRNSAEYVKDLKKTKSPLVLTVNGKAEIVVMDADSFQEILNKIEYVENVKAIQEGIESFERGEGKSARESLTELGKKYGV
jgi:prevent-host-death family protein